MDATVEIGGSAEWQKWRSQYNSTEDIQAYLQGRGIDVGPQQAACDEEESNREGWLSSEGQEHIGQRESDPRTDCLAIPKAALVQDIAIDAFELAENNSQSRPPPAAGS